MEKSNELYIAAIGNSSEIQNLVFAGCIKKLSDGTPLLIEIENETDTLDDSELINHIQNFVKRRETAYVLLNQQFLQKLKNAGWSELKRLKNFLFPFPVLSMKNQKIARNA